ncbi:MAG: hypothetical protein K2P78_04250 [Gemmataceae bacterium]|nr:hypothetical protein [Gemmataceae bacterium]
MNWVFGTYINGEIVLDTIPDWPDGTEVTVTPIDLPAAVAEDEDEVRPDAVANGS